MNKRQNIRQLEMGERLDEMLNMACEWQHQLVEQAKNIGIDTKRFLATYRIHHNVGFYASQRYFNDFMTSGVFRHARNEDGYLVESLFIVNDTEYQTWKEKHKALLEVTTQK